MCGDPDGGERITRVADQLGMIGSGGRGLRVELLSDMTAEASEASDDARAGRAGLAQAGAARL